MSEYCEYCGEEMCGAAEDWRKYKCGGYQVCDASGWHDEVLCPKEMTYRMDSVWKRLAALEGKAQAQPDMVTMGKYESLENDNISMVKSLQEMHQINAELQRRLDAKPSKRAQVAEAFLHAALRHPSTGAEMPMLDISHWWDGLIENQDVVGLLAAQLERMAAVLEQAAKDEATDGE